MRVLINVTVNDVQHENSVINRSGKIIKVLALNIPLANKEDNKGLYRMERKFDILTVNGKYKLMIKLVIIDMYDKFFDSLHSTHFHYLRTLFFLTSINII